MERKIEYFTRSSKTLQVYQKLSNFCNQAKLADFFKNKNSHLFVGRDIICILLFLSQTNHLHVVCLACFA